MQNANQKARFFTTCCLVNALVAAFFAPTDFLKLVVYTRAQRLALLTLVP